MEIEVNLSRMDDGRYYGRRGNTYVVLDGNDLELHYCSGGVNGTIDNITVRYVEVESVSPNPVITID